jgi:ABC-2 type transport system ATP-binding protein
MSIIETRNLTKYFNKLCAVDSINLEVGNEIFGLLGPNGAGKSTSVLMLTTLLKPSQGEAYVCGYDVARDVKKVRNAISYVSQDMAVDIKLTGYENVMLYAKLYGVPDRKNRVDEVLELMGLDERKEEPVRNYSGGMRRRLELAQALVHEPEVSYSHSCNFLSMGCSLFFLKGQSFNPLKMVSIIREEIISILQRN